jgi:hypothetical protein
MTASQKSAGKNTSSVRVMPQTKGNTLCVEMANSITKEDYERNLRDRILEIIDKEPHINLLFCYTPSYKGWEPDAADLSLKSIMDLGHYIRRQAYVNAPEKIFFRNKLSGSLFSGEIRYFAEGEFQDALEWVTGGEEKNP